VAELGVDTDPFMLHLYAALAEKERRLIAERLKAAGETIHSRLPDNIDALLSVNLPVGVGRTFS
jgi:hypothetical protein